MDWFVYDNSLRHERAKEYLMFHNKVKKREFSIVYKNRKIRHYFLQ